MFIISNRIRQLRKDKSLTLEQLGKKMNLATSTIGQYERETREPKLEIWQKLANFFNVSVPYIQGISDELNVNYVSNKYGTIDLVDVLNHHPSKITIYGEQLEKDQIILLKTFCKALKSVRI
ncbi:helix-turn-helix domain-containing protein [uncultured Limosilactobacillus sp.]|uniref:helix-turn-helix domain-containing protein n=1 Tax=uncultured Limosilactobacillus sp. TaxID=2837629 RepID=UPI0025FEF06C|nr:helix-turn-helix transcriptional regulator [uncultured Limosilactobacillus sp.]